MSLNALAMPASTISHGLTLLPGGAQRRSATWYERRSMMRGIVGGCPDHWWNPASRRTAACTCDRY